MGGGGGGGGGVRGGEGGWGEGEVLQNVFYTDACTDCIHYASRLTTSSSALITMTV